MTATTKTVKAVNYTSEQEAMLAEQYGANPSKETVEKLAVAMGKATKSIVAKLVSMKIYKKAEYKTKTGETVQAKAELADAIGKVLKLSENDTSSLESANKNALKVIFEALANSVPLTPENEFKGWNKVDTDTEQ